MLINEEKQIQEAIVASRKVQEYLWGEYNGTLKNGEECFEREFKKLMILM